MKKLLKMFGSLIAFVIIALLAAPMFISADFIRQQLTTQVKNATGRDLVIKGNTSIKLFPNIAVSAEDVTLGNPEGFTSPYLVSLKKLETGAALKPLLAKELRITGVTLVGATLNLEQNAAGAKNWDFAGAKKEEKPETKTAEGSSPLKAFAIGDIVLKDTVVNFSKPGAKPIAAKDINLTLSGADGSKALKLDGSAIYQNEKVSANLAVDKMKALMAGKTSPVVADIALPSGAIKFKGTAGQEGGLTVNGGLDVAIADLPKLLTWATGKQAADQPKKIALKSNVEAKGAQAIALNDLSFSVDALSGNGKLALNLAGKPSVNGALNIPTLDLNAMKGGKGGDKTSPEKSPAAAGGWSDEKIDFSGLNAVNANLDLAIGALKSGNINVSDIKTNVAINDGALKMNLANASLYGGSAKGVVSASAGGIGTNMVLSSIDIEQLMTALSGASRLEGKTNLTLAVKGAGSSQRAIVSSLAGNAALKVNDGAVKGMNIASFLRDAKKAFIFSDNKTEKTDFTEMTATFQIAQGVVSNQDLSMKSPVLRIAGKGTVSLPPRTLNYRLESTLVGSLKGQGDDKERSGITIPLVITGPWSAPSVTPDLTATITDALKDPTAIKENIRNIKDTIGDINSPKDIGKALLGGGSTPQPAPATGGAASAPAAKPKPATKEELIQEGVGSLLKGL
jgi:AsmA protein